MFANGRFAPQNRSFANRMVHRHVRARSPDLVTGAKLVATLPHALEARNLKHGVAAPCIGGRATIGRLEGDAAGANGIACRSLPRWRPLTPGEEQVSNSWRRLA